MTGTLLQSAGTGLDPGAATVTYPSNVVSGSKLIAYICTGGGGNPQVTAIKDAALNSMTKIASAFLNNAAASGELSVWAMDTPAGDVGAKPTLTATQTGGNQSFGFVAQEVSGLLAGNTTAMIDGTAVASTGSISANGPIACGAYSTTASGEYLVAVGGDAENSTLTWATPTGSTTYTRDTNARNATVIFNCVPAFGNSTGGAETASFAITGAGVATPWATLFVAFKLSAGGGGAVVAQSREHRLRITGRRHGAKRSILQPSFGVTSSDLAVNAGLATGIGASLDTNVEIDPNAGLATATGTAQNPTIGASAQLATATATSQSPTPAVGANAGLATGAGVARQAGGQNVQLATATGISQSPTAAVGANAGLATGTAVAQQAEAQGSWVATGVGTAQAPTPAVGANAGLATGIGSAPAFGMAQAQLATAAGVAQQPTIQTSGNTNAPAQIATGTAVAQQAEAQGSWIATGIGVAQAPTPAAGANAGLATSAGFAPQAGGQNSQRVTATGTAQQPTAAIAVNAGLATATGTAPPFGMAQAQLATAAGTAQNATVSTASTTNAPAGLATGTGAAQQPAGHNTQLAAGTGAALPFGMAQARLATGTGAGQPATILTGCNALAGLAAATGFSGQPAGHNAQLATAIAAALQSTVQASSAIFKATAVTSVTGKTGAGTITGRTGNSVSITGKTSAGTTTGRTGNSTSVTGKATAGSVS